MSATAARERAEAAGVPAAEAHRIEEAVAGFDLEDLRERATDLLIGAYFEDHPPIVGEQL